MITLSVLFLMATCLTYSLIELKKILLRIDLQEAETRRELKGAD